MAYNFILVEMDGGVMKITLNRPDVLNSFNLEMARELHAALDAARAEKTIRAVLLTGAGRGFCAGRPTFALRGSNARTVRRSPGPTPLRCGSCPTLGRRG